MIANVRPFPLGVAGTPMPSRVSPHVWAVVLAGRPLGRGPANMRRAVDRAARLVPNHRLVSVLCRQAARDCAPALADVPEMTQIVQPTYRGSAAEFFLPVLVVARRDPNAVVVAFSAEEGAGHDGRLLPSVQKAVHAVALRPDLTVLVGGRPRTGRAVDGWIEPGSPVEGLEDLAVRDIRRFVYEPAHRSASAPALLSTVAIVARARTLIAMGRRWVPEVLETLEPLEAVAEAPEASLLCEAVYECMPYASLSRELLERGRDVAVLPVPEAMAHSTFSELVRLAS
jgi:mannose-1-phosphate guanylyltransferase